MQYKEFELLKKIIKEICANGPVYYLANQGNLGDSLIRHSTLKFFQDIGLDYIALKSFNTRKKEWWRTLYNSNGTLIFAGGGAWCDLYNREENLKKVSKRFKHIIVLPSTFESTPSISNTTFFCRDQYESKKNVPNAIFCHDMAFYLGKLQEVEKGKGKGYFFRTDKESLHQVKIPTTNNDISSKGNHNTPIDIFINAISKFEIIYTDRLHIAIAASLMQKEVHLYPNSYFKNKAVYLSSLKESFPNTYFHENMDFIESS